MTQFQFLYWSKEYVFEYGICIYKNRCQLKLLLAHLEYSILVMRNEEEQRIE